MRIFGGAEYDVSLWHVVNIRFLFHSISLRHSSRRSHQQLAIRLSEIAKSKYIMNIINLGVYNL